MKQASSGLHASGRKSSMKTKYAILIFLLGILVDMTGGLFKIMHWPGGDQFLIAGTVLKVTGLLLIGYKILTNPKLRDFLDS